MTPDLSHSAARLKRLLPRFRKLRIGVLGDLMLDRYVLGEANRLSTEVPVAVVDYKSQEDFPGGAANVAMNIAALGAHVEAFGVIGGIAASGIRGIKTRKASPDEPGACLLSYLRKAGAGEKGILPDGDRLTTLKTRIIASKHQIVRIDRERRDPLSPETEEKLFRMVLAAMKKLDALILSDYDKGLLERRICRSSASRDPSPEGACIRKAQTISRACLSGRARGRLQCQGGSEICWQIARRRKLFRTSGVGLVGPIRMRCCGDHSWRSGNDHF